MEGILLGTSSDRTGTTSLESMEPEYGHVCFSQAELNYGSPSLLLGMGRALASTMPSGILLDILLPTEIFKRCVSGKNVVHTKGIEYFL